MYVVMLSVSETLIQPPAGLRPKPPSFFIAASADPPQAINDSSTTALAAATSSPRSIECLQYASSQAGSDFPPQPGSHVFMLVATPSRKVSALAFWLWQSRLSGTGYVSRKSVYRSWSSCSHRRQGNASVVELFGHVDSRSSALSFCLCAAAAQGPAGAAPGEHRAAN